MDYKTIKALLEKYWEGQTSLTEEQMLKEYFQQKELPAEWQSYAPLFQMLHAEKKQGTSAEFDKKWIAQLDSKSESSASAKIRPMYRWAASVAAVLLFLPLGLYLFQNFSNQNNGKIALEEETYESPEEAYAKAKEVLLLLSTKMKDGTEKANDGIKKVKEASTIFKLKND